MPLRVLVPRVFIRSAWTVFLAYFCSWQKVTRSMFILEVVVGASVSGWPFYSDVVFYLNCT